MHYRGVDYHKSHSYIVVKNEEARPERRGTANNTSQEVQRLAEPRRRVMSPVACLSNSESAIIES
jgi:hypothetical protein